MIKETLSWVSERLRFPAIVHALLAPRPCFQWDFNRLRDFAVLRTASDGILMSGLKSLFSPSLSLSFHVLSLIELKVFTNIVTFVVLVHFLGCVTLIIRR